MKTREVYIICNSTHLVDCVVHMWATGFVSTNLKDGNQLGYIGLLGFVGGADEWNCIVWRESIMRMSSIHAQVRIHWYRRWSVFLIMPSPPRVLSLKCFRLGSDKPDDKSRQARTCLECITDGKHDAAIRLIHVDTEAAARMVNEWVCEPACMCQRHTVIRLLVNLIPRKYELFSRTFLWVFFFYKFLLNGWNNLFLPTVFLSYFFFL